MMRWFGALAALALLAACTQLTPHEIVFEDAARQQQLRTIQTHSFAVTDRIKTMRAVIVTLQDLDFVIDQADSRLGFISATKLNGYHLDISVLVDDTSPDQMLVRAGFAAGLQQVEDASYQEFFASLQKNLVR
jgi:hypothetical protein